MKKNKAIKGLILAVMLVMALSNVAQAASHLFEIENHIGYTIHKIFVSPAKTNNWGKSILGSDTLKNNELVGLRMQDTAVPSYDLKVCFADESAIEWYDIDLMKVDKIILKEDGTIAVVMK